MEAHQWINSFRKNLSYIYEKSECNANHPRTKSDLSLLAKANRRFLEFWQSNTGLSISYTSIDPYETADEMFEDIRKNNTLAVFSGGSECPYLSREENLVGRAVHDLYGHFLSATDYSFEGELYAYLHQKNYYREHLHPVLFSEIVLQSAFFNTHKTHKKQKLVLLPMDVISGYERTFLSIMKG